MKALDLNKNEIIRLYTIEEFSISQISKIYNCSNSAIRNRLLKNKIKIRKIGKSGKNKYLKYNRDKNFFNNANNAYWAGWIAADGSIHKDNNTLQLDISIKDRIILEKFKEQTKFEGKIKDSSYQSKLYISGAQDWIYDLNKYWNITPNKKYTLKPPNVNEEQKLLEYIIGFIDGDGSIGIYNDGPKMPRFAFNISGTFDMMYWFSKFLYKFEAQNKFNPIKIYYNKSYIINYGRMRGYELLSKIKNTTTPFRLERKWNKIEEYAAIRFQHLGKIERIF